jgi:hypothetical protein
MKKHTLPQLFFSICFLSTIVLFSQSRVVIKDDAYLVLNTAATTDSVFVVLANGNTNALATSGTGGNIITEKEKNQIKWKTGTNTGTYILPFTTATTATNASESKIPASVNITGAGTGSGNLKLSTYTDNDATNNSTTSDYKPSDVTSFLNFSSADNSANVVNRFWILDANGYTDKPDVTLSFTYDDDEVTATGNSLSEANIFPQRWNSTASDWSDVTLSGTINTTSNTLSAVTVAKENFFRSWALVSSVTPLPVELLYFEVKRTGSYVLLQWETLSEINNDYFIVEKSSDSENWEEILTVDGQGNTNEQTYYSQIDVNGCEGVCYYRLIQVDFNGQREKEGIRVLNSDNQNQEFKISVIPNPINRIANISFSTPESGVFNLIILNQQGQMVYSDKTIGEKGNNHLSFKSSVLAHGSYYFILEDENGNRRQQLVIK